MTEAVSGGGADERPEIGFRLNLDGKWSAIEFAELLEHLQFLNDVARLRNHEVRDLQGNSYIHVLPFIDRRSSYNQRFRDLQFDLEQESAYVRYQVRLFANEVSPQERDDLQIVRMSLASPGNLDLAGFGKIAKEVRLFVEGIIDRFSEDRKIETQLKRQKLVSAKIANANKILALGAKVDMPQADRQAILREVLDTDRFVETKVLEGKITDISSISK
ncbi:hypothetical protein [Methylobacterium sp. 37f]|uniref:hypothetical protein n=1 Tax=Methylobacterium sp. 37f TaxID=2817058 RepID=UPI001FFD3681|nr:hypothetical protein [Methylobacterium sp. 37f]MCK2056982.1 hypothetical protein [Methylobacterium sp. 37f]